MYISMSGITFHANYIPWIYKIESIHLISIYITSANYHWVIQIILSILFQLGICKVQLSIAIMSGMTIFIDFKLEFYALRIYYDQK
jgi:hypothetical protein